MALGRRAARTAPRGRRRLAHARRDAGGVPGSWDEQAQAYQKAMQLLPDNPTAFNNLAWMYLEKGRAQEASALGPLAVRMAPWESSMLDTLAGALAALGRCSEAWPSRRAPSTCSRNGHARAPGRVHRAAECVSDDVQRGAGLRTAEPAGPRTRT